MIRVTAGVKSAVSRTLGLLIVAPFERGKEQGGSQRATAMAERMEERGVEVFWRQVNASRTSRWNKAAGMARLEPSLVGVFPPPKEVDEAPWQIAIAAHSFLAPQLDVMPDHVVRVTDFHNLEWQHLSDSAALEKPGFTPRGVVRALYLDVQIRILKRFERSVDIRGDLSLFVSDSELVWARRIQNRGNVLLVPSVLPNATEG